jgi:hypothetical protein
MDLCAENLVISFNSFFPILHFVVSIALGSSNSSVTDKLSPSYSTL